MSFILDSNVCIAALNGRPISVVERLATLRARREPIAVPTVALFELWYGIAKSVHIERNTRLLDAFIRPFQILAFDSEDARVAGDIRARLEKLGPPIGPYDCLIAAQTIRRDAILVTANVREFSRVKGLRWENWAE